MAQIGILSADQYVYAISPAFVDVTLAGSIYLPPTHVAGSAQGIFEGVFPGATPLVCTFRPAGGADGYNIFVGYAGNYTMASSGPVTEASRNICIGTVALVTLTTGYNNIGIGVHAGQFTTTGYNNTFVGTFTGEMNDTGHDNVAIGQAAFYDSVAANLCVAIGSSACRHSLNHYHVAVGANALAENIDGVGNTAIGYSALASNLHGNTNVAIGFNAGYYFMGSDTLFIDNAARANEAAEFTNALVYGIFAAATKDQYFRINANVGLGTHTFGANSNFVLGIANGTAPAAHVDDEIQIYSKDASTGGATLGIETEAAVEAIGTFTASNKLKVWINGTEYWIQLDAV